MSETERNVMINKASTAENSYHVKLASSEFVKQLVNKNRYMSLFPNYQTNYQNKQKSHFQWSYNEWQRRILYTKNSLLETSTF